MTENRNPEKKSYSPPVLHVYGDIRTITQAASMTATHVADGGTPGMNKT